MKYTTLDMVQPARDGDPKTREVSTAVHSDGFYENLSNVTIKEKWFIHITEFLTKDSIGHR